ncbi:MAG: dTDP-4-dehydrorhamnose reductase [Planctomycetia bacterium]|nr:dTDP-4-dehydrorhamnose reductase [Planctomycetia bacterium]
MRIALIGATGQLGGDLLPRLQAAGHDVRPLGHADIEITNAESSAAVLEPLQPDLVINTAAYNLVDKAEDDRDAAMAVNGLGPQLLARLAGKNGWRLMHISTDYVFGDVARPTPTPFIELDLAVPSSRYGLSKLTGEKFVQANCSRHFVVRTCGLYGIAALRGTGKGNFVETMLRLGRDRKQLRVVDDQICTPTSTADLSDALVMLVATDAFGLYHATNSGCMTWCEFAREIFRQAKLDVEVIPITTAEFGAKAKRPNYSVLDCRKLMSVIETPLPDWHEAIARYLVSRQNAVGQRNA